MLRCFIKLRRFGIPGVVLILAVPESVTAQAIPTSPVPVRYSIKAGDAALVVGSAVLAGIPVIAGPRLSYALCGPCDSISLWGIDRRAVGRPNPTAGLVSDGTLALTTLGAGVLLSLSRTGEPDRAGSANRDFVVLAEAVQVTEVINQWAKVFFHRPRPVRYSIYAADYANPDNGR